MADAASDTASDTASDAASDAGEPPFPRSEEFPDLEPADDDLVFQVLDWYMPESDKAARKLPRPLPDPDSPPPAPAEYDIYMFGATAEGHSVCLKAVGFQPGFFVKPPTSWWKKMNSLTDDLKNRLLFEPVQQKSFRGETYMGPIIPKRLHDHLVRFKPVKRKDFWGFTNGQDFPFIHVQVRSQALFNKLRRYFADLRYADETKARARAERTGEPYDRDAVDTFKLYESNIEPFLRFIHERRISPSGWVHLPAGTYDFMEDSESGDTFSRAVLNVTTEYANIYPYESNQVAPLLMASWDIECTSSHGDFPVANKTYQKLALNLIQAAKRRCAAAPDAEPPEADEIAAWILGAFARPAAEQRTPEGVTIHPVYAKQGWVTARNFGRLTELVKTSVAPKVAIHLANAARLKARGGAATEPLGALGAADDDDDSDSDRDDAALPQNASDAEAALTALLDKNLPPLEGDPIIQIGTTVQRYGSDEIIYKYIAVLGTCDPIPGAIVESYDTEEALILGWREFIQRLDPDLLIGYNVFGFDHDYLWRRAQELQIADELAVGLGRIRERTTTLLDQRLSSSALGDNFLYYLDLDGIVQIDMLKVMQRDHKLDSYKLDHVAATFLGDNKADLKPREIFEKFQGDAADRAEIARYCLQDCALVNRLLTKLKIIENTIGMSAVCTVPLSYLFMRGQGVKIFSLVSKECREQGYVIPTLRSFRDEDTDPDPEADAGYEGAIVLPPKEGMYLSDPITVFDYASLYPSSMIERNLSHDCYVRDPQYLGLEEQGISYITVTYDVYEGVGDKKRLHSTNPKQSCTFAQLPEGKKGIIPNILMKLLNARKTTRKKIEYETLTLSDGRELSGLIVRRPAPPTSDPSAPSTSAAPAYTLLNVDTGVTTVVPAADVAAIRQTYNSFEQAVLDALQLAYKVTANSLYGQIGARTSPIYWKDIAACTTATGRERIMLAKGFMEREYGAEIIYGDTDSIFTIFPHHSDNTGERIRGKPALALSIAAGQRAAKAIKPLLPYPQSLEYEKTLYPFILFSKKRYVGNLYEDDPNKKPKQKSMGIVLKRRDNAQIVKQVYGGIIDILLNKNDLAASVAFFHDQIRALVNGETPIADLVITKTLKGEYKDPLKIAHKVLADRMGARDPGNKPMPSDRIPYVYIRPPPGVDPTTLRLQGDRIEHPEYIREQGLTPDYRFYITNQLLKPICQLYALCVNDLPGYSYGPSYWEQMEEELRFKKTYADSDKKRKDRLTALKMAVVEELLFEPYLAQLPDIYKPPRSALGAAAARARARAAMELSLPGAFRAAANGTAVGAEADAIAADIRRRLAGDAAKLVLSVVVDKAAKAYQCTAEFYAPGTDPHDPDAAAAAAPAPAPIWTSAVTMPNKARGTTTKQLAYQRFAEDTLAELYESEHQATMTDRGVCIRLADKTVLTSWRKAIAEAPTMLADMEKASQEVDLSRINELRENLTYYKLVSALDQIPYIVEAIPEPPKAAAAPTDGAAPPPAKRTRKKAPSPPPPPPTAP